jgi:hypothetical protein
MALAVNAQDRCLVNLSAPPTVSSATSSNLGVATVSVGSGVVYVTAVADGQATIAATANGISATRTVAVGAGANLAVSVTGGPRENLVVGETVWLSADHTPAGQSVTYAWRVNGGDVISTSYVYAHLYQGPATVSVEVTSTNGQTASASATLSGGGSGFRIEKHRLPLSGRP